MPRYFFHLSFGQRVVPDEEGVELPNWSAARDETLAVIRDLANRRQWRTARAGSSATRSAIRHPTNQIRRWRRKELFAIVESIKVDIVGASSSCDDSRLELLPAGR